MLILGAQLVEEGVRQLHAAAPQLPYQTEGRTGRRELRLQVMCLTIAK